MQKRSSERINANLSTRLSYAYTFYSGTVLNLSEEGMFIWSKQSVPVDKVLVVLFRIENEPALIISRVKWVIKRENYSICIGVEILNTKKDYLQFVENLRQKEIRNSRILSTLSPLVPWPLGPCR